MRLFVAVELPDAIKDELARVSSAVSDAAPGAKWVPRDNFHLTLSFLGEVPDERLTGIAAALDAVAEGAKGIRAHLGALGAFPSARRGRVLWVELSDDGRALRQTAEATAEALESVGFQREARPWAAHITLARFRTPGNVSAHLGAKVSPLAFDLSGLAIYRSRLGRPAPRYEVVSRLPHIPG